MLARIEPGKSHAYSVFDKDNQPMIYFAKDLYLINQERETACNLRKTKENFEFCGVNDWNGLGTECVCCNMNKEGCADIQGPIEMKFDGHDTCFCKNTTPNPNEVTAVAVEK